MEIVSRASGAVDVRSTIWRHAFGARGGALGASALIIATRSPQNLGDDVALTSRDRMIRCVRSRTDGAQNRGSQDRK